MSASTGAVPANVGVSKHPLAQAKLSQLRSQSTRNKDVKGLVHDITTIIGVEAFASVLNPSDGPVDKTKMGFEYTTTTITPSRICLVPILRSGLGMVDAMQALLPDQVPVHHLGLYREPTTLQPVEYYNNLTNHAIQPADPGAAASTSSSGPADLAIILDPIIATGNTCAAAIQTLREWGVHRIVVLSVLGAVEGLQRAAAEWPEGVAIHIAGIDAELTPEGMLRPGLGDIGDRLFSTIGK